MTVETGAKSHKSWDKIFVFMQRAFKYSLFLAISLLSLDLLCFFCFGICVLGNLGKVGQAQGEQMQEARRPAPNTVTFSRTKVKVKGNIETKYDGHGKATFNPRSIKRHVNPESKANVVEGIW